MVKKEIIWSELAKLQFKAILEYYVERNGNEKGKYETLICWNE